MTVSYWGVEHGEVSKAYEQKPSTGRRVAAAAFPVPHGAIAGRKGKKLRATGNQAVGAIGGGYGGALAGGGLTALLTRGRNAGAVTRGSQIGGFSGAVGGSQLGLNRNQRKGYMKKQPIAKSVFETNKKPSERKHSYNRPAVFNSRKDNAALNAVGGATGAAIGAPLGARLAGSSLRPRDAALYGTAGAVGGAIGGGLSYHKGSKSKRANKIRSVADQRWTKKHGGS